MQVGCCVSCCGGVAAVEGGGVDDEDEAAKGRVTQVGEGGGDAQFAVSWSVDEVVWRGGGGDSGGVVLGAVAVRAERDGGWKEEGGGSGGLGRCGFEAVMGRMVEWSGVGAEAA